LSGIIAMFANLNDSITITEGFSLALLVLYYALMLELLLVIPFRTGIKKRIASL